MKNFNSDYFNNQSKIIAEAAFIGFGEVNTPKDIIEKKCLIAKKELENLGVNLKCFEIVSDDQQGLQAKKAIEVLQKINFDFIVVCIAGWIPTWAVLRVVNNFSNKPMLLWGLSGYYDDKNKLYTTADQAGTTAIRKVFEDLNYNFKYIYNFTGKNADIEKIKNFAVAVKALNKLKSSKISMMGYRDMNLYSTFYDPVLVKKIFGTEFEHFEMLEINQKIKNLDNNKVLKEYEKIKNSWKFTKPAAKDTLIKGIKYYLSIKEKIEEKQYDAISLIDVDGMKKLEGFPPAMVFMLISNELNIPSIPENDSYGSLTQLISKYLTGQISAYFEFYEFMEDRILVGVPDFIPKEVTDGDILVMPTKFGDFNEGILNVSKVKTGIVTLARFSTKNGKFILHLLTGKAVSPRPWEEVGWTPPAPQLPSLEIILDVPIEDFASKVLSQHYILTYGDNTKLFIEFCNLHKIDMI